MSTYIGITGAAPPSSGSITLDLDGATKRVANLMRRNDINGEIAFWLDFSLKELCDEADFPELRTVGDAITCVPSMYEYSLPADYSRMSSVYYKCTSTEPNYGRNLEPLPRSFYKGDTVDFEKLLNNGNPARGDPKFYFVEKNKLIVYPAFHSADVTGTLVPTYYRVPADWVEPSQLPAIDHRWHHYLIWLAYSWGMAFEEKADVQMVRHWEGKFEQTIEHVKRKVNRRDNKRMTYDLPNSGFEQADVSY